MKHCLYLLALLALWCNPLRAEWRVVETTNFILYSQEDAETTRAAAEELEQFRAFLTKALNVGLGSDRQLPLTVFMLDDREAFDRLTGKHDFSGVFRNTASGPVTVFFHDEQEGLDSRHVMKHEYVHYLMRQRPTPVFYPLWYSEGMAEFLSSFFVKDGLAQIGAVLPSRYPSLKRKKKWLPLKDVMTQRDFDGDKGKPENSSMFYSQAWALTHALFLDPEIRENLTPFLRDLARRKSPEDALNDRLGLSYTDLEDKFAEHVKLLRKHFRKRSKFAQLTMEMPPFSFDVRRDDALTEADGEWLEQFVAFTFRNNDQARAEQLTISEEAYERSNDPRFLWLQSRALVHFGRWQDAEAVVARALSEHAGDPFVNLAAGQYWFDLEEDAALENMRPQDLPWEKMDWIDEHLNQTLQKDPDNIIAREYQIRSLLFWGINSMDAAGPLIREAYSLYPQYYPITRYYLELLLHEKRFDEACNILRPLFHLSESGSYRDDLKGRLEKIPNHETECSI